MVDRVVRLRGSACRGGGERLKNGMNGKVGNDWSKCVVLPNESRSGSVTCGHWREVKWLRDHCQWARTGQELDKNEREKEGCKP